MNSRPNIDDKILHALRNIKIKIKQEIPLSAFSQGNARLHANANFADISDWFCKIKSRNKIRISKFLELLKFITSDFQVSDENYKKMFIDGLEMISMNLKSITHKSRQLKAQIIDVLEDKMKICDSKNVMRFFSTLLQANIVVIVSNKSASKYSLSNETASTITIKYEEDDSLDYNFSSTRLDLINADRYSQYISSKLISELSIEELKKIFENITKCSSKQKTKSKMIEQIESICAF